MGSVTFPTTAQTAFGIVGGIAGGIGALILARRLKKAKSVDVDSLVIASIITIIVTIGAVYLIKSSNKAPEGNNGA